MSDYRSKPVYNYPLFDNAYPQSSAIDDDHPDFQSAGKSTPRNAYYPLTINPREVEQQPNNFQSYYTTSSRNASISSGSNLEEENENTAPQRATGSSRRRSSNSRTQSVFDPNRNMFVEISRSQRHYCPEPDCVDENGKRKSLSRLADLKRHKNSVHAAPSIDCHYPDCDKQGENGFKRKDHYMDHLRDRHRELRETSRASNEF